MHVSLGFAKVFFANVSKALFCQNFFTAKVFYYTVHTIITGEDHGLLGLITLCSNIWCTSALTVPFKDSGN